MPEALDESEEPDIPLALKHCSAKSLGKSKNSVSIIAPNAIDGALEDESMSEVGTDGSEAMASGHESGDDDVSMVDSNGSDDLPADLVRLAQRLNAEVRSFL